MVRKCYYLPICGCIGTTDNHRLYLVIVGVAAHTHHLSSPVATHVITKQTGGEKEREREWREFVRGKTCCRNEEMTRVGIGHACIMTHA